MLQRVTLPPTRSPNSLQMERKISPQNVRSTNYKSVGKNLLLDYVRVFEDGHQRIAKGLRGDDGGPSVIAKNQISTSLLS
jgi:hypothetical protein